LRSLSLTGFKITRPFIRQTKPPAAPNDSDRNKLKAIEERMEAMEKAFFM
jgi:hypothetical protein